MSWIDCVSHCISWHNQGVCKQEHLSASSSWYYAAFFTTLIRSCIPLINGVATPGIFMKNCYWDEIKIAIVFGHVYLIELTCNVEILLVCNTHKTGRTRQKMSSVASKDFKIQSVNQTSLLILREYQLPTHLHLRSQLCILLKLKRQLLLEQSILPQMPSWCLS